MHEERQRENEPTHEDRLTFILVRLVDEWCSGQDYDETDPSFADAIGALEAAGYLELADDLSVSITETGRKFAAWFEEQTHKRVRAELSREADIALGLFPKGPPFTAEQMELIYKAIRAERGFGPRDD